MNKILYSAIVLDNPSKERLLKAFNRFKPEGWTTYIHHMTVAFGKALPNPDDENKEFTLVVSALGISDKAVAVKVNGYPSNNNIPHITLFINPIIGKPVDSNNIINWEPCDKIILTGIAKNIKK